MSHTTYSSTTIPALTIGLDLGDRLSQAYAVDAAGTCVEERAVATTAAALTAFLAERPPCRVVLEVGKDGWLTAEGGQGGKKTGYDRVCKKRYAGPPEHLRGWVSIKALANAAAPTQDWIGGRWGSEEPPSYSG